VSSNGYPVDISGALDSLSTGELSAVDLVSASIAQIEWAEPRFNAFTSRDHAVIQQAAELDRFRLREGRLFGPLHGIPVGVKDCLATETLPTTLGSEVARDWIAGYDATVVRRLRAAGAIVMGKNNLHEAVHGATGLNSVFGDIHNPWDTGRIAGGSSAGSAAAVAAGEIYASLGSDSGGSIRIPASLCGVVGFKPSYGRVSLHGLIASASSLDHIGPLTRTVTDAARIYDAIGGYDHKDPHSSVRVMEPLTLRLEDKLDRIRVGVVTDDPSTPTSPEVSRVMKEAVDALTDIGLVVEPASLEGLNGSYYLVDLIALPEVSAHHRVKDHASYGRDVRRMLRLGEMISATQYLQAKRAREEVRRRAARLFDDHDYLVMPTVPVVAPPIPSSRDNRTEPISAVSLMRFVVPFNLVSLPAISVPCGLAGELPVGLQFVGRSFDELGTLKVARAFESARPWPHRWPMFQHMTEDGAPAPSRV
jgi:aspartyl-tRNA(Asn)/glutamyl-tRNA(Gln) amidotransferase subunit A